VHRASPPRPNPPPPAQPAHPALPSAPAPRRRLRPPQGVFPPHTFKELGLPGHWYGAAEWQYPPHQRQGSYAEEGRSVNHLKAGIATADRLLTVSPGAWGRRAGRAPWGRPRQARAGQQMKGRAA
jgi:hypothetical protein